MSEELKIPTTTDRAEIYQAILPQLKALVLGEPDFIANVANLMSAMKEAFHFLWVGCYFVKDNELVLGPFQGPVACTRIKWGKGVCGFAWEKNQSVLVPDVDAFPGHIACSSFSKSEVVVPIRDTVGSVIGVLDVDSEKLNDFSSIDQRYLEEVASIIGSLVKA